MKLSETIKNRRRELGLTLEAVASAVSVDRATVLRWERGEIKSVKGEKLTALADCLALPVSALLPGEGYMRSQQTVLPICRVSEGEAVPTAESLPVSPLPAGANPEKSFLYRVEGGESEGFIPGDLLLITEGKEENPGKNCLFWDGGRVRIAQFPEKEKNADFKLFGVVSAMFREF